MFNLDEELGLPTEGRFDEPLEEARHLGALWAEVDNRLRLTGGEAVNGPVSPTVTNYVDYTRERLAAIRAEHGQAADDAYQGAYDDAIDLSLSNWRNELPNVFGCGTWRWLTS